MKTPLRILTKDVYTRSTRSADNAPVPGAPGFPGGASGTTTLADIVNISSGSTGMQPFERTSTFFQTWSVLWISIPYLLTTGLKVGLFLNKDAGFPVLSNTGWGSLVVTTGFLSTGFGPVSSNTLYYGLDTNVYLELVWDLENIFTTNELVDGFVRIRLDSTSKHEVAFSYAYLDEPSLVGASSSAKLSWRTTVGGFGPL